MSARRDILDVSLKEAESAALWQIVRRLLSDEGMPLRRSVLHRESYDDGVMALLELDLALRRVGYPR